MDLAGRRAVLTALGWLAGLRHLTSRVVVAVLVVFALVVVVALVGSCRLAF